MAENTVKVDISFRSLLAAISSLEIAEKHQLLEFIEAELFPDEEDSPEDIAEIKAARDDYRSVDNTTFDVVISPVKRKYQLDELLVGVTPELIGGEYDWGKPVGGEAW